MKRAAWRLIAFGVVLAAALRVLAAGYLPYDDALRHVAKAVSGRPWSEILLIRPGFELDSNPGWHVILGALHRLLGLGSVDLLIASVILLFVLYSLGPILLLRRPEAWLLALALLNVLDPGVLVRLMSGRPFVVSSAIVPLVLLLWPRLETERWRGTFAVLVACGAAACWIHGSYYLLALPVLALVGAGRWRAGTRAAAAFAIGIVAGAFLTGHPFGHLWQMVFHGYSALATPHSTEILVSEFRPFDGEVAAVVAFFALLAWRRARRPDAGPPWRDPAVVMAAGCWALGYVAARFWTDWSAPALVTLAALEVQDALERRDSRGLALLAGVAGVVLVLVGIPADSQQRWSLLSQRAFLSRDNPTHAPWVPDPGGIVYTADMGVFYALFFKNPDAPWRYVLGFEPAMMPPEEYRVYAEVKRSNGVTESYLPWLRRMRPADRLYVVNRSPVAPPIPGLEWFQPVFMIWSGRLPRPPAPEPGPPAATAP